MIEQLEHLIPNFSFEEARSILLKGEKGSGKTTFIKTLINDLLNRGVTCMFIFTETKPEELIISVEREFKWDWKRYINESRLYIINGCVYSIDAEIDSRNLNRISYFFEKIPDSVDTLFFDSLTNILLENDLRSVINFIQKQEEKLNSKKITSFFSVETGIFDDKTYNGLAYCFQNIMEFKIKEENDNLKKYFRVFNDITHGFDSQWYETDIHPTEGLKLKIQ